jgi:mRNA interferase RelE/StbE
VSYSLKIKRSAFEEIQALPKPERLRVVEAIDRLPENPHVGKLLKGDLSGLRRIRVGDYRIVYEINEGQVLVLVLRVAHRKNVYR